MSKYSQFSPSQSPLPLQGQVSKSNQQKQEQANRLQKYLILRLTSSGDYVCNDHFGNTYLLVCQFSQSGLENFRSAASHNFHRNSTNRALLTPFEDIDHEGLKFTVYILPQRSFCLMDNLTQKQRSEMECLSILLSLINKVLKPLLTIFESKAQKWFHLENVWIKQRNFFYILNERKSNFPSSTKNQISNENPMQIQKKLLRKLSCTLSPYFKFDPQLKTFLSILMDALINQQLTICEVCFLLNDKKKRNSFLEQKGQKAFKGLDQNNDIFNSVSRANDLWKKRKSLLPQTNRRGLVSQTLNIDNQSKFQNDLYQKQIKNVGETIEVPPSFTIKRNSFSTSRNRMFDFKDKSKKRNSLSSQKQSRFNRSSQKILIGGTQNIHQKLKTFIKSNEPSLKYYSVSINIQQRAYKKFKQQLESQKIHSSRYKSFSIDEQDKKLRSLLQEKSAQKNRKFSTIDIGEMGTRFRVKSIVNQTVDYWAQNEKQRKKQAIRQSENKKQTSEQQYQRNRRISEQEGQKRKQQQVIQQRIRQILKQKQQQQQRERERQKEKENQIQRQKQILKQKQKQIQKQKEKLRQQRQKQKERQRQKIQEQQKERKQKERIETQKKKTKQEQKSDMQNLRQSESRKNADSQNQEKLQEQKKKKETQMKKNESAHLIRNPGIRNNLQSVNLDEVQMIEPKMKAEIDAHRKISDQKQKERLQKINKPPLPTPQAKQSQLKKSNYDQEIQQITFTSKRPNQAVTKQKEPTNKFIKTESHQNKAQEQKPVENKRQREDTDSHQRTKTVTSEIASSCGPKKPVHKQVAQYMHMINKMGESVAKSSRISAKLQDVQWFTGIYFVYKRFLFQRKKIEKWLETRIPNLTRYQQKNKQEWEEWFKGEDKKTLQEKVKAENANILSSIIKMNKKIMKKSLPGNFLFHAALERHSEEESKIAVSEIVKQFDLLEEKQKLNDQEILVHINQLLNSLYIIAQLDGKIQEKKPLVQLLKKKNPEQLSEFSDFIYDLYIKE